MKLIDVNKALKEGESKRMSRVDAARKETEEIAAIVEEEYNAINEEIEAYYVCSKVNFPHFRLEKGTT